MTDDNRTDQTIPVIGKIVNPGISIVSGLIMAVVFLVDLWIPLGVAIGVFYIFAVLFSLLSPAKNLVLLIAFFSSVLLMLGFFLSPPGALLWKVILNRIIALLAIWATALLGLQRKMLEEKREAAVRQREEALRDVRILRGFLPICASCKKIRDVKGYWNQMESYIKSHSEADFSHSICPECVEKLYHGFSAGKEKDEEKKT